MTTNERINAGRYKHFSAPGDPDAPRLSPFDRGVRQNCTDFFQCRCLGKPSSPDWRRVYRLDEATQGRHGVATDA